jgi:ABC-type dipeptide/oligopeptide/nickel transport system permease component
LISFLLRRMLLLPFVLIASNLIGFVYASTALQVHQSQNPFGIQAGESTALVPAYLEYARGVLRLDFGAMPTGTDAGVAETIGRAALASLGLLGIAFTLSLIVGLPLGLAAVQVDPPRTRSWLTLLSTLGLAMPGFYLGTLAIAWLVNSTIQNESPPPLPLGGFGWDVHLLLPVLALAIRPTMQIAQVAGTLLAEELGKRYVTAARGFGHTWRAIRRDKALRNILASIYITSAGALRATIAELLLVEWLFTWPGLGLLLVRTLVPPKLGSLGGLIDTSVYFLHPPLMAALLTIFGLVFFLADTISAGMARSVDPRIGIATEEASLG